MDQRSNRLAQDAPTRRVAPAPSTPRNGPLVWWAAGSFAAILGFSRLSYGLLLPAVQRDLGGTYSVYGTLATLNFVGYLLGTLCLPLVLARTPRRLALSTGASLAMNGALLASASSLTPWQLGIWRVLIGVFSAPATALAMADDLARFPPHGLHSDRLSVYEQWALSWEEALGNETRRGLEVLRSGESIEGARRFAAGHGRHGSTSDI